MDDEDSLRVGGWVSSADPAEAATAEIDPHVAERSLEVEAADPVDSSRSSPTADPADPVPAEAWQLLPDPDTVPARDTGSGRYRGRRRYLRHAGRRAARWGTAAVVASVGVVLIGSGVLANYLSDPVTLPVVPPTPSLEPAPTADASPQAGTSQLGVAPTPTGSPTPSPSPVPPPAPAPAPEPPPPPPAPPPPPREPVSLTLEAEAGELGGNAQIFRLDAASGDVVRLFGWCDCNLVAFTGVSVDRAGEYQLTIQHGRLSFEDRFTRTARVVVNGGDPVVISLSSPSRGEVESVSLAVELAAGANTIEVTAASGNPGPNLDLITVEG